MSIDYDILPAHMRLPAKDYVEDGCPVGSFLQAVLENKLYEAFCLADMENSYNIRQWAMFLREAPIPCWGSHEKVKKWMAHKGLRGYEG